MKDKLRYFSQNKSGKATNASKEKLEEKEAAFLAAKFAYPVFRPKRATAHSSCHVQVQRTPVTVASLENKNTKLEETIIVNKNKELKRRAS